MSLRRIEDKKTFAIICDICGARSLETLVCDHVRFSRRYGKGFAGDLCKKCSDNLTRYFRVERLDFILSRRKGGMP